MSQVARTLAGAARLVATSTLAAAKAAGDIAYAPRNAPLGALIPAYTDGRTMAQWRAKIATFRATGTGKLKVMFTGDSWTEKATIPQAAATLLYTSLAQAGGGYISIQADLVDAGNNTGALDGATFSKANWTLYDASTGAAVPTCGTGIDGQAIYTSGTTATASFVTTLACTDMHLSYYAPTAGTMRYRVDGDSWVNFPAGSGVQFLDISGLANASHQIDIDTSINTAGALIGLHGLYFSRSGGAGTEVLKCGNSSLYGSQWSNFIPAPGFSLGLSKMAPDAIVVILGTNDYRLSAGTAAFSAAITAFISTARAALPNVAIILVAPSDSSATGTPPLTAYRDTMASLAASLGVEFYNMHGEWASYAVENALGQWFDTLHVSPTGGYRAAARLKSRFLDL